MHRSVMVAIVLMAMAPVASAGTEEAPEIQDELGDVRWNVPYAPGPSSPFAAAAALDVDRSWFHDETSTEIQLTMKVADLANVDQLGGSNGGFGRWGTRFELSSYVPDTRDNWWNFTWIITVDIGNGAGGWRSYVSTPDANGQRGEDGPATHRMDVDQDRFTVTIPRSTLGYPDAGDRMFDLRSLHDGDMSDAPYATSHSDQSDGAGEYVFQVDSQRESGTNESLPSGGVPATGEAGPVNATSGDDKGKGTPSVSAPMAGLAALAVAVAMRRGRRGAQSSK